MTRKLHKALKTQKSKTQRIILEIYGTLGIPLDGQKRVDVDDRPNYVYVKLRDNQNEVIQAFNNTVAASYGLPVVVRREGTRYSILGVNSSRYQSTWNVSAPYLPKHGNAHSFSPDGGADVTWVYSRQFMPLLGYPTSSYTGTSIMVGGYGLYDSGSWRYIGNTGTANLLPYLPTGIYNSIMALVYLDTVSGNPGFLIGSGSYFQSNATGTGNVFPYIPVPSPTQIPVTAVKLDGTTTEIGWGNIYDVRQWVHATPSGTSSGGGGGGIDTLGFAGLDEGIPIGTGTFLNVVGAGATFTRSGTMFNLDIPGGSGDNFEQFWNSGTSGKYSIRAKNDTGVNASGDYAVAIGDNTNANGESSFAQGKNTVAQAPFSHAEGVSTQALGTGSHAEGSNSIAYANYAYAQGNGARASGTSSISMGDGNYAGGNNSAAIGGLNNIVRGVRSVVLGGVGISGGFDDTVFVPKLNIQTAQAGTPVTLLGINSVGNIVSGSATSSPVTIPPWGLMGQDEGVPLGTGTVLNVVGAGATLSLSGTVLNLNIPGGGGGVDQIGIFGKYNGVSLATGTTLNVQSSNNTYFTASGTTLDLRISGSYINLSDRSPVIYMSGTPTWTKPANLAYVIVEIVGGGGGGGAAEGTVSEAAIGGGGGGGEYAKGKFVGAALGATENVTVGSGGSAGAVASGNGGDGATTSFGTLLTAGGGLGGSGQPSSTSVPRPGGSGGAGGSGGTGVGIHVTGNAGQNGIIFLVSNTLSSIGGGNPLGGATRDTGANLDAVAGAAYGGGAAGGRTSNNNTDRAGALGGNGVVIIYEYIYT